ncbi:MAG: MBL fold metallo-hydrolase [Gemmatimonadetes bacterium]|nr:ComEC/Rec2 family competence protein [Gemmatimonadota bacterium]NIR77954.1 ComEC/Rec2 family competence protein [Gemmatimonadota bacterium]NIT86490.1 ComEC/Rec2 family competence protein [Gemmatimonadota bacterium]NIU30341.1 ComEC/Rec2 family competence protein [Gemmatimonadota bacterium]NIU35226.1 MBL fold metallo-hydrolase [Gemmatimonadota bacterium]
MLAAGRVRGTPVLPLGGLASAFLLLLLVDPGALLRPGFQLSFAGVAGLILGARPLEGVLAGPDPGALRRSIASPVAAAIAATLATLPLVAWHFGRVPLVGIPATLLTTPLVALAIPGIVAALLLSTVAPGPAHFLAGGVELLLDAAVAATELAAGLPGAAPWVPRSWVPAGVLGVVAGAVMAARLDGVTGWRRRVLLLVGCLSALIAVPGAEAVARRGALEMAFLSVGQGDAVALRSPAGRWILVDAGPRSGSFDAGARRVVPWLRRRGVGRLEALILTHPDLDHLGGAPAVLSSLEVGGVLDPGVADPRVPFGEALEAARRREVGWWGADPGRTLFLDGVEVRVLHAGPPPPGAAVDPRGSESNAHSVVLLVSYGGFRALLTGDAPAAVEGWIVRDLGGSVDLLKVGHHGSRTSTSLKLLEAARPELAVISVGWRNRFGHPHRVVLDRLRGIGARILRTDLHGTVIVRAARDGSWSVEAERDPGRRAGATRARPRGAGEEGVLAPARR